MLGKVRPFGPFGPFGRFSRFADKARDKARDKVKEKEEPGDDYGQQLSADRHFNSRPATRRSRHIRAYQYTRFGPHVLMSYLFL